MKEMPKEFIIGVCKEKGWNPNKLSLAQVKEIRNLYNLLEMKDLISKTIKK